MEKEVKEIRVRFAPSPTGNLHLGGARTCLFNFLFARKNKGKFILRIEDTDQERSKPEFIEDIIENLKWLNLIWDEGPYFQSQRLEIYQYYLQKLIQEKKAYYCFCTPEELRAEREYQIQKGEPPKYSGKCRTISIEEAKKRIIKGEKAILRFKVPLGKIIKIKDLIKGEVKFKTDLIGDFSIAVIENKKIRPLYNFAVVVDDQEMKISHIIRGEDHLSNTPKQILLQKALKFKVPEFAHLPLILGPDKSKLSKRHGAVAIRNYKEEGYLPEAMINFLALLGWSSRDNREIFTLKELIENFSLENVQKSPAIFNPQKLDYINSIHIRRMPLDRLLEESMPFFIKAGFISCEIESETFPPAYGGQELFFKYKITTTGQPISYERLKRILSLYQERLKKLSELSELVDFFFKKPKLEVEKLVWKTSTPQETLKILEEEKKLFSQIEEKKWKEKALKETLLKYAEKIGDRGKVFWPPRVAVTGKEASAPFTEIAEILGKKETLERINRALNLLKKQLNG